MLPFQGVGGGCVACKISVSEPGKELKKEVNDTVSGTAKVKQEIMEKEVPLFPLLPYIIPNIPPI